jgi:alanine racemase
MAVGQVSEVAIARQNFSGDIVVLQPWRPFDAPCDDPKVIRTVSRATDLAALGQTGERPRVLVEAMTSMKRHGLNPDELQGIGALLKDVELVGWTVHLPMPQSGHQGNDMEAIRIGQMAQQVFTAPVWLSHLSDTHYSNAQATLGDTRLRVGTELWLGDRETYNVTATVLDIHPVRRGESVGYWQRRMPTDGFVVVVAGGTSNGIALEAPTPTSSVRRRLISLAEGVGDAAGLALSPFTIAGKKRFFVEPPHMQSSLVFLPDNATPPQVGDEVPVEVRLTTATVDTTVDTD